MTDIYILFSSDLPHIELDSTVAEGIAVPHGKFIHIPAYVTGRPYPEITWSRKDGVQFSDRVSVLRTKEGWFKLCPRIQCTHYISIAFSRIYSVDLKVQT